MQTWLPLSAARLTYALLLGQWVGPVPLPAGRTYESVAQALTGDERDQFVSFVQRLLDWLPEERLTTGQLYNHPWLRET